MKKMIMSVLLLTIVFSLSATTVSAETSSSQQDFVKMFILDVLCKDEEICGMDLKDVKLSKEKIYDIYLLDIALFKKSTDSSCKIIFDLIQY